MQLWALLYYGRNEIGHGRNETGQFRHDGRNEEVSFRFCPVWRIFKFIPLIAKLISEFVI